MKTGDQMAPIERAWQHAHATAPMRVLANPNVSREARLVYAILCGMREEPDLRELARMMGMRAKSVEALYDELSQHGLLDRGPYAFVLHDGTQEVIGARLQEPGILEAPQPASPRKTKKIIGRAVVSDEEEAKAASILLFFNRIAGTNYTLNPDHMRMLVLRIRRYPDVSLEEHESIISGLFSGEHWWDGAATLNLVYGNDAQFERCRARVSESVAMQGGTWTAQQMRQAARMGEDQWPPVEHLLLEG